MVFRAIWKNIHSWVFQKLQIALVLRTRAISIVFKKLTRRACFFQIALETILLLILIKTFCDEKLQNKFCITKNIHICLFIVMRYYTPKNCHLFKVNKNRMQQCCAATTECNNIVHSIVTPDCGLIQAQH